MKLNHFEKIIKRLEAGYKIKNIFYLFIIIILMKINKFKKKRLILGPKVKSLIGLFKLIISILVISHLFACIWILVHRLEYMKDPDTTTWLTRLEILDLVWWK